MYISRIQIKNFRNFHDFDVQLGENAVIVGENKIGKRVIEPLAYPQLVGHNLRLRA